jgi:hypothetical protein
MTPAERRTLEQALTALLNLITDAAKAWGAINNLLNEDLLNEDQTVAERPREFRVGYGDDRPKPGPPR